MKTLITLLLILILASCETSYTDTSNCDAYYIDSPSKVPCNGLVAGYVLKHKTLFNEEAELLTLCESCANIARNDVLSLGNPYLTFYRFDSEGNAYSHGY